MTGRICMNLIAATACLLLTFTSGCETGAQTGGLAGAGIGALAGQAIGGSTKGTLIGAGVGAGIGYIIGNESDKKKARGYSADARHSEVGPFPNTKWTLVSLEPANPKIADADVTVEFKGNEHVVTTYVFPDGTRKVNDERYRVVGEYLIVNSADVLVNYRYKLDGNMLELQCEDLKAGLKRM